MNLEALAEEIGLEPEEYLEMLEIFLETGDTDLQRLEAAIVAANAEEAHEAAHSLKGSSGSLGLEDIFALARDIDDLAREGALADIGTAIDQLRLAFTLLTDETKTLLAGT